MIEMSIAPYKFARIQPPIKPIRAIETEYAGCWFRSRLEARWAVFFDSLGLRWEYEAEGFDLGADLGWYLPDFWFPERKSFVEIKPYVARPQPEDIFTDADRKIMLLSTTTGKVVDRSADYKPDDEDYWTHSHSLVIYGEPWPGKYCLRECWDGYCARVLGDDLRISGWLIEEFSDNQYKTAYKAARRTRFDTLR